MTTDESIAPAPAAVPTPNPPPEVLFINGFHRSGTTVMTSAVTEAVGGVTTTVAHLARHIPTLEVFLDSLVAGELEQSVDRGVDRLTITASTAEEYGFLLYHCTGKHALYGHPDGVGLLRGHIAELAAESPTATIVLKNPWEMGREARMLADFPGSTVLILRRRMADIERSMGRALLRAGSSDAYPRALGGDDEGNHRLAGILASRWQRTLLLSVLRLILRRRAWRLARSVRALPLDRVALLSYDEMRADPRAGAAWAGHLVDAGELAEAFTRHAFAERSAPTRSGLVQRALDRRWARAWDEVRAAQIRAGVLTAPLPR
jgi:hypothetical protein